MSLKEKVSDALALPKEVSMDCAKITITGENEMGVENSKGILEYASSMIRIKTSGRTIVATGEGMEIGLITDEEVELKGKIDRVEFV